MAVCPGPVDPLESVAIGPIGLETRKPIEFRGRQQPRVRQPRPGAVRLDDVPDARVAGGEACRSVVQAIPSTSIME